MAKSFIKSTAQVIDPKYLMLYDLSVYNTDVPVTNAIYRITLPNFNQYVEVNYTPGTLLNVNSNILKLTDTLDPGALISLPTGLYVIRQSICPNDKLYYEYRYFNIQPDLEYLTQAVCDKYDDKKALEDLFDIKMQLETAKMLAEGCGKDKQAAALYNVAKKRINYLGLCSC